ncbi:MOSC domain-containing protein [Escherichia coli]|nr:MOSC domain-containing protein [Escherichia coli]
MSFADGYPYLLANEASLRDLQQRCPASVKMEQFRPNLVVSGASALGRRSLESDSHW